MTRTLIYGMQSSGASLFAYFLSQRPETIGIIDLWHGCLAPDLAADTARDVVLKCVVTERWSFEDHVRSFQPDVKILFLRDEDANRRSLSTKPYRNKSGSIERKFQIVNECRNHLSWFDHVVHYETFTGQPGTCLEQLGDLADLGYYAFRRSRDEIIDFNSKNSRWCRKNHLRSWSFGNIHWDEGLMRAAEASVRYRRVRVASSVDVEPAFPARGLNEIEELQQLVGVPGRTQ
jgi:hypothetical protein